MGPFSFNDNKKKQLNGNKIIKLLYIGQNDYFTQFNRPTLTVVRFKDQKYFETTKKELFL